MNHQSKTKKKRAPLTMAAALSITFLLVSGAGLCLVSGACMAAVALLGVSLVVLLLA